MKKNLLFYCGINDDMLDILDHHINNIKKYNNIFDGYKLCYMTKIQGSDELLKQTKKELDKYFDKVIIVENDSENRETRYFIPMLEDLFKNADKDSITFYGHSKGSKLVTQKQPVLNWSKSMYYFNLDSIWLDDILEHLKQDQYKCAGIFKDVNDHYKFLDADPRCKWWYQGTFFWFKQEEIFKLTNWRDIYMSRWGTESFLGAYIDEKEAYCILCNEHTPSLYSQATWDVKLKKMAELIKNNP